MTTINKNAPKVVQLAQEILITMQDELALLYKKKLPAYALQLEKSGTTVTPDILKQHVEQGLVLNPARKPKKAKREYQAIISNFPFEEPTEFKNPVYEFNHYVSKGDLGQIDRMIAQWGGVKIEGWGKDNITYRALIEPAFCSGNLDLLKHALAKDTELGEFWVISDVGHAIERNDWNMVRYAKEELGLDIEKQYSESPYTMYIEHAMTNGHMDMLRYVLEDGFANGFEGNDKLKVKLAEKALKSGIKDHIDYFASIDAYDLDLIESQHVLGFFYESQDNGLSYLINDLDIYSDYEIRRILLNNKVMSERDLVVFHKKLEQNSDEQGLVQRFKNKWKLLSKARMRLGNDQLTLAAISLRELELPEFLLSDRMKRGLKWAEKWEKIDGAVPKHLTDYNPFHLHVKTYRDVIKMMEDEGMSDFDVTRRYAYNAAALFRSTDRVLQYLEKWGGAGKQPLHDIIQYIEVPNCSEFHAKEWGDAVLQHGPAMARLVTHADKMPLPEKSDNGETYSLVKTRDKAAQFTFKNGAKNPELAKICADVNWKDKPFEKGLALNKKYQKLYKSNNGQKREGQIPEVNIDGDVFNMAGYRLRKLADGDLRGLVLGEYSACCQHLANAGAECAEHGYISENGGFYVVEDSDNKIIAQSWAWRGKNGELTLDSLESMPERMNGTAWQKICEEFAKQATAAQPNITAIHVGTGGATPSMDFARASKLAEPKDYKAYRDSTNGQYAVWQSHSL